MANGIYLSMAGAAARAEQLEVIADNLANAQTPGFRASRPAFETVLARESEGALAYAALADGGLDPRPGALARTGSTLDIALPPDHYFAVRTASGRAAYTRAGRITVDGDGTLLVAGRPLLDASGGPIVAPPHTNPQVDPDGAVRVQGEEIGRLGVFRVDGPLARSGPQLFLPGPGARVHAAATPWLRVGELEMSNAGALESAVALIAAQRGFDFAMQAIEIDRRLGERANEVGRVR